MRKEELTRWSEGRGKQFEFLIEAYKNSNTETRRRLIVYSEDNLHNDKQYKKRLKEAVKFQEQIKFEVRVLSDKHFENNRDVFPKNSLICDEAELIRLNDSGECDTTIRENDVRAGVQEFETLWKRSTDSVKFLNEIDKTVSQRENSDLKTRASSNPQKLPDMQNHGTNKSNRKVRRK